MLSESIEGKTFNEAVKDLQKSGVNNNIISQTMRKEMKKKNGSVLLDSKKDIKKQVKYFDKKHKLGRFQSSDITDVENPRQNNAAKAQTNVTETAKKTNVISRGFDNATKSASKFTQKVSNINLGSFGKVADVTDKVKGKFSALKASTISAFSGIKAVGVDLLKQFAPFLAIGAFSWVTNKLFNLGKSSRQDDLSSGTKNIEKYQKKISSYESKLKDIKGIQDEFNNLSKGVDTKTNENIGLSTTEYERYLELKKKLISINDDVVNSYDIEGNAIINNSTAIQDSIDKYEKLTEAKKNALVSNENLFIQNNAAKLNMSKLKNGGSLFDLNIGDAGGALLNSSFNSQSPEAAGRYGVFDVF